MAKPKVAVDLSFAHRKMGYAGIPQDSRLLFSGLATSSALDIEGMLWSTTSAWHGGALEDIENQSIFLGPHLHNPAMSLSARMVGSLNRRAGTLYERLVARRYSKSHLHPLVDPVLKDIIWRQVFAPTVEASRRHEVMAKNFALCELGWWQALDSAILPVPRPMLDTSGYDWVIFQDSRNVRLTRGTKRIIRYHDGLPVTASDTMMSPTHTQRHIRTIRACAADSFYVCNSESARDDLLHLCPQAAENAAVIPYFVPAMQRQEPDVGSLVDSAAMRVSTSTLDSKTLPRAIVERWFQPKDVRGAKSAWRPASVPKFILSLATIEPRKNYQGLIRAWQHLRRQHKEDIKLVIIGRPGWEFDAILHDMRPPIAAGDLLHLAGVPQEELKFWYSAAACFAFPSFAEGFGLPPIEAMQCGCPVMVSDIAAHRYSAGDAALYCDPYDFEGMARILWRLLDDNNQAERDELQQRAARNTARFTVETVRPKWEELLTTGRLRK